jgi:hypothetical protein
MMSALDCLEVIEVVEPLDLAQVSINEGVPCLLIKVANPRSIGRCLAVINKETNALYAGKSYLHATSAVGIPVARSIEHLKQVHKPAHAATAPSVSDNSATPPAAEILVAPTALYAKSELSGDLSMLESLSGEFAALSKALQGLIDAGDAVGVCIRHLPSWSRAFQLHFGGGVPTTKGSSESSTVIADDWPVDEAAGDEDVLF